MMEIVLENLKGLNKFLIFSELSMLNVRKYRKLIKLFLKYG